MYIYEAWGAEGRHRRMLHFCEAPSCWQRWGLCTLSLSIYILWLCRKACNAQIADEELLRGGKETCTGFTYSEDWMSHSHPTTCKGKLATFLFHSRGHSNRACFFLQFLFSISFLEPSSKNPAHQSYDCCTCCSFSDTLLSGMHERKSSRVFSTTGLPSYWGRLNTRFSEEKTV